MGEESTGVRMKPEQVEQVEAFEKDHPALFEDNRSKTLRTLIGLGLESEGYRPGIDLPNGMAAPAVTDGGFTNFTFLTWAMAVMTIMAISVNAWAWFSRTEYLASVGLLLMGLWALTATMWFAQSLYDHATGRKSGA